MTTQAFAQRFWGLLTGRKVYRWQPSPTRNLPRTTNVHEDLLAEPHLSAESRRLLASAGLVMESVITVNAGIEATQQQARLVPVMARLTHSTGAASVEPSTSTNTEKTLIAEGEFFAIRVNGDAMAEAAIRDGDLAVIRNQSRAKAGQIVAVLINNEAIIRELEIDDEDNAWLKPRNDAYPTVRADDAIMLGRVTTIIRRL